MEKSTIAAPKKGMYFGWWVAMGTMCGYSSMCAIQWFPGMSFPQLSKEFGWTAADLGLLMGMVSFAAVLWGPVTGWICDRIGNRKTEFIFLVELTISVLLLTQVTAIWEMFILWPILIGLGSTATLMIGIMSLPRKWFIKRAGLVTGLTGGFWGIVSAIVFPLVTSLGASIGWRMTIFYLVPIFFVLSLAIIYFWIWDSPERKGLNPDGMSNEELAKIRAAMAAVAKEEQSMTLGQALKTPQFWLISIGYGLIMDETGVVQGQSTLMGTTYGVPIALSGTVMSALMIPAILGRGGIGPIGDRWGRKNTILVFGVVAGLVQFGGWLLVHDPTSLYIFMVLLGLTMMGGMTLFPPLFGDLFGRKFLSSIFGFGYGVVSFVSGTITIAAGYVRTGTGSYNWVFFMLGANFVLLIILMLLCRPTKVQIANATKG